MQRLTNDALAIVRDVLIREREQIKENIVGNVTNFNLDLVEKGKAQLCVTLLSKLEEVRKERQESNNGRTDR